MRFRKNGAFARSSAICPNNNKQVRQQVNTFSSFVDGTQIYGSSIERAKLLRTSDGKLN